MTLRKCPYFNFTALVFQSDFGHICTNFCLYLPNISPIYYQNQGHISVILIWENSENPDSFSLHRWGKLPKLKVPQICGKKRGDVSVENQKLHKSKCRLFWDEWGGGPDFQIFPKITWQKYDFDDKILVRYRQCLVHIWLIYDWISLSATVRYDFCTVLARVGGGTMILKMSIFQIFPTLGPHKIKLL